MLATRRSWKRQGPHSPLEPREGARLCRHLDFGPVILILDFCSPEL